MHLYFFNAALLFKVKGSSPNCKCNPESVIEKGAHTTVNVL